MRTKTTVLASLLLSLLFVQRGDAVDLTGCNQITDVRTRTECLHSNTVLLNAAFEVVTRELRGAVQELRTTVQDMKIEIAALKAEVADLKKNSSPPDLSNFVRFNDQIQLESRVHFGTCLDHNTHNAGHIQGWACGPGQAWKINRR